MRELTKVIYARFFYQCMQPIDGCEILWKKRIQNRVLVSNLQILLDSDEWTVEEVTYDLNPVLYAEIRYCDYVQTII